MSWGSYVINLNLYLSGCVTCCVKPTVKLFLVQLLFAVGVQCFTVVRKKKNLLKSPEACCEVVQPVATLGFGSFIGVAVLLHFCSSHTNAHLENTSVTLQNGDSRMGICVFAITVYIGCVAVGSVTTLNHHNSLTPRNTLSVAVSRCACRPQKKKKSLSIYIYFCKYHLHILSAPFDHGSSTPDEG